MSESSNVILALQPKLLIYLVQKSTSSMSKTKGSVISVYERQCYDDRITDVFNPTPVLKLQQLKQVV